MEFTEREVDLVSKALAFAIREWARAGEEELPAEMYAIVSLVMLPKFLKSIEDFEAFKQDMKDIDEKAEADEPIDVNIVDEN